MHGQVHDVQGHRAVLRFDAGQFLELLVLLGRHARRLRQHLAQLLEGGLHLFVRLDHAALFVGAVSRVLDQHQVAGAHGARVGGGQHIVGQFHPRAGAFDVVGKITVAVRQ